MNYKIINMQPENFTFLTLPIMMAELISRLG